MEKGISEESRMFRMGAAAAIGELYATGSLGNGGEAAETARRFLKSFGIGSRADLDALGIANPNYLRDFDGVL